MPRDGACPQAGPECYSAPGVRGVRRGTEMWGNEKRPPGAPEAVCKTGEDDDQLFEWSRHVIEARTPDSNVRVPAGPRSIEPFACRSLPDCDEWALNSPGSL